MFSREVMSESLWSHGLQHARLPWPSPSPGACSNSSPSNQWCHLIISFSVVPISSCLQSSPASGFFPMNWLFALGGQGIGVSALASVLPMTIQGWFPLGLTGLISLLSSGLSRIFSGTTVQNHQFFGTQSSLLSKSHICIHDYWKNHSFVSKVMSLLFNMLSRFVIAFCPKLGEQASFNFMAAVTVCSDSGAQKIKSVTVSIVSPSICHETMTPDAMSLVFWMLSFKPAFLLSSFTFTKGDVSSVENGPWLGPNPDRYWEILLTVSSKCIQNSTTSHHFCFLSLFKPPSSFVCITAITS